MREFISVQNMFDVQAYWSLKKDALMFDKIAINPRLQYQPFNINARCSLYMAMNTIDWLEEKGIVFRLSPDIYKASS